jgi:hypothetical protein
MPAYVPPVANQKATSLTLRVGRLDPLNVRRHTPAPA